MILPLVCASTRTPIMSGRRARDRGREAARLAAPGGVPVPRKGPGRPRKDENAYNNNVSIFGNSAHYRVGKLRRDHPAIADRLAAGEFKSVAAAERAAKGEPQPLDHLKHWWRKATDPDASGKQRRRSDQGRGLGLTWNFVPMAPSCREDRIMPPT